MRRVPKAGERGRGSGEYWRARKYTETGIRREGLQEKRAAGEADSSKAGEQTPIKGGAPIARVQKRKASEQEIQQAGSNRVGKKKKRKSMTIEST